MTENPVEFHNIVSISCGILRVCRRPRLRQTLRIWNFAMQDLRAQWHPNGWESNFCVVVAVVMGMRARHGKWMKYPFFLVTYTYMYVYTDIRLYNVRAHTHMCIYIYYTHRLQCVMNHVLTKWYAHRSAATMIKIHPQKII